MVFLQFKMNSLDTKIHTYKENIYIYLNKVCIEFNEVFVYGVFSIFLF